MICLDTNYLIRCIGPDSVEAARMAVWYRDSEPIITPMPAWFEFLCGPVTPEQEKTVRAFLKDIIPFNEIEAKEAARLFNAVGRKRNLRVDAMIAATAIVAKAPLATINRTDLEPFIPYGLELI